MQNRSALLLFLALLFSPKSRWSKTTPHRTPRISHNAATCPPVKRSSRLEVNRWRTRLSSNEGQPTISSSSCNIQAEWAHGSALAPFGTCNKLNQLPRHLRDKLHKRAVRAWLHGLVFCALARRVYSEDIGGRCGAHVSANENDISCEIVVDVPIPWNGEQFTKPLTWR